MKYLVSEFATPLSMGWKLFLNEKLSVSVF